MKLTIEPTATIQMIDGVPCRRWEGATDKDVPVHVWVRCVSPQTHDAAALADFERELRALPAVRREAVVLDMRFVS